ncbi:hypothetical protein MLD38_019233 [Melastoma candidum]|uniref:Uncharacterized protein n=1 Tax=Melastoma candidum TaxID=119954 RepID=A0ACB9QY86_9MYRT|nr:hypothetical protein MLD38_019233 [Melastoma candidum]
MEGPEIQSHKGPVESAADTEKQCTDTPVETPKSVMRTPRRMLLETARFARPTISSRQKMDSRCDVDFDSPMCKAGELLSKPNSTPSPGTRRNSTGGLTQKESSAKSNSGVGKKEKAHSATDGVRRSLPEPRKPSLPSFSTKPSRASDSDTNGLKQDAVRNSVERPASPTTSSSSRRYPSTSSNSVGCTKMSSKVSSPSARTPTSSAGLRASSLSSSIDKGTRLSRQRRIASPDSRDIKFMMLPQVEIKASDDVRLDLRGHRVRTLNANGLNLSPNLEFVYLRDNLLSTLEGVEILSRVKVLDLSFNDFKGPGFEPLENCKALQQLYLAGNQITSLASLPQLPNLEFLSVAQNKLKSLAMATQPRLQVLAASKNKISTLKEFPHLPSLEHLRIEENPIIKMLHLEAACIMLVGPTMKKFNDRDLSREELVLARRYPTIIGLCIRYGMEFCRPDQATDSSFRFLVEQWKDRLPPGYILKGTSVDKPFEEDACSCHFNLVPDGTSSDDSRLELKYQWFIGGRTPCNFTAIPDATDEVYWPKKEDVGKILKVECTIISGETEHPSIFAVSLPVHSGTKIPKVANLDVVGDLVEGNIIKGSAKVAWCGGTPGKGACSWLRRKWNGSPEVIPGAEDEEYRLTLDDIDTSLVFMYTPVTEEGTKGEPQYKYTDFIKAAPPTVNNVSIMGDLVEGYIVKGVGDYFGGREGPSKFEWLREDKDNGDFVLVTKGTAEYTLTKEDVGCRLAFVYVPINFEGQEGESVSVVSARVKQAPPKVTNLKIIGDLRESSKITVAGQITGGTEAASKVQWFKSSSPRLVSEDNLEALSTAKTAKTLRIPLGAVGCYIFAKYVPMTPDGDSGKPAYAVSERAVEYLPPSMNFLSITGEYTEGGILTASYGYIGGHEGKSIYKWYLHEVESDSGTLIDEASGLLEYHIPKEAIGKFISFQCTPVRNDGMIGEPRTCKGQEHVRPGSPRLLSLHIMGHPIEGNMLCVDKQYWGGEEGNSIFRWVRTNPNGIESEITGANDASYPPMYDDIGCFICVSCEPVRNDSVHGPVVLSRKVGPVIPGPPTCHCLEIIGPLVEGQRLSFTATYIGGEKGNCWFEWSRITSNGKREKISSEEFLDLSLDDVGTYIELTYTPVRDDGMRGTPKSLVSDIVVPADPVGLELSLPDCYQRQVLTPLKKYYGGEEGVGELIWLIVENKPDKSELLDIFNSGDSDLECVRSSTYTPLLSDIGKYVALYWVPTRSDGKCGKPLVAISDSPVAPARPLALNVYVKKLSSGVYSGEGEYFGGYEGSSLYSWYREDSEGTIVLVDGANSKTYEVTDSDYNCRLLFGYTPVRSDSFFGDLKLSEATEVIYPDELELDMLALTGTAMEGNMLTAVEVIPKSETQQHLWNKYKKDAKYQWFRSPEVGGNSFEPMPSQRSCIYRARFEDIGRCLRCECVVTDVFGRSTEPAYAKTSPIQPGMPRIDKLEIEGMGFHTNLYTIRGIYSGGIEGKSKIQWLRAMVGSPDLISIQGETGSMYQANVDDVGYRLVAMYTPVREDGVEGPPVSASTDPIAVEPDLLREVKQKLELGSVKFEVLCDKDRNAKKSFQAPGSGTLERRVLEINRKRAKVIKPGSKTTFATTEIRGTYAPPFHVELFQSDQHRLRIVVDSDNGKDLVVQSKHLRDIIVLVIRGLAQRFNSISLNTLLKIET